MKIFCRLFGHRWRRSMMSTHIVTGAGERADRCSRCREYRVVPIPPVHLPGDDR